MRESGAGQDETPKEKAAPRHAAPRHAAPRHAAHVAPDVTAGEATSPQRPKIATPLGIPELLSSERASLDNELPPAPAWAEPRMHVSEHLSPRSATPDFLAHLPQVEECTQPSSKVARADEEPAATDVPPEPAAPEPKPADSPTVKTVSKGASEARGRRPVQLLVLAGAAVALVLLALAVGRLNEPSGGGAAPAIDPAPSYRALDAAQKDSASVDQYYVYGTRLNLSGSFTDAAADQVDSVQLLVAPSEADLSQAVAAPGDQDGDAQGQEGSAAAAAPGTAALPEGVLARDVAFASTGTGSVTFQVTDKITDGISLEGWKDGAYVLLLRVTHNDGSSEVLSLADASGEKPIDYYTLTREGKNHKVALAFASRNNVPSYLSMTVSATELPKGTYDIAIDPGHGGMDSGAVVGDVHESDLVLQTGLKLRDALEAQGYKVIIARDGSESPDENMAYGMYDEDGSVNVIGGSGAKLSISLHCNYNEADSSVSGVQVYTSARGGTDLAELLASNIVSAAGTGYSPMGDYRVADGVYQRSLSAADIEEMREAALEAGYEPYDLNETVDYYYMIREMGGMATGAYTDGRNPAYGTNEYRDSNRSPQDLLVEMGFMSSPADLQNLQGNQDGYVQAMVDTVNAWAKAEESQR